MGKKTKGQIHQLSVDTIKVFEPYINVFGCGQKVYVPSKDRYVPHPLITKETRGLYFRYKAGQRNLFYDRGDSFKPFHFVNGIFSPEHVEQHVFGNVISYFTSNQEKLGIGYFDLDNHCRFQKDAPEAKKLVAELLGDGHAFWRDSNRGINGYVKFAHHGRVDVYNALLKRLEAALHHFLRSNQILTDIEVLGGINTWEKNAHLAKLPFSTFAPCTGRDSWNYVMLHEFQETPILSLAGLARLIQRIEANTNLVKAAAWDDHVETLRKAENVEDEKVLSDFQKVEFAGIPCRVLFIHPDRYTLRLLEPAPPTIADRAYRVGDDYRITITPAELCSGAIKEKENDPHDGTPRTCGRTPGGAACRPLDSARRPAAAEPCLRQPAHGGGTTRPGGPEESGAALGQDDCLGQGHRPCPAEAEPKKHPGCSRNPKGVRRRDIETLRAIPCSLTRQLKAGMLLARILGRVPTEEELLDFLKKHGLFSGRWEENEGQRKARVAWIVDYISQTFDRSKCNQGHVDVEKYRDWAKQAFPERISLYTSRADELLNGTRYQRGYITHEDIAIYLSIFEFCLEEGQFQDDKGIPHGRVFALWKKLYREGVVGRSVSDLKIRVIRETLVSRQVIQITDRNYSPVTHLSMRYDYGKFFPGKKLYREAKKSSLGIVLDPYRPGKFRLVGLGLNKKKNKELNTVPTECRSVGTPLAPSEVKKDFFDTS